MIKINTIIILLLIIIILLIIIATLVADINEKLPNKKSNNIKELLNN